MPGISEVPQDFDHNNDDEQALARKCDELVNKPFDKLTNNEKRMVIEYLKNQVKEKEKQKESLFLYIKRKENINKDDELRHVIQEYNEIFDSKLHLGFIFASPLVIKIKDNEGIERRTPLPPIDYKRELSNVINGLKKTENHILWRQYCATHDNLLKILCDGAMVLHFSGHGAKNDDIMIPKEFNSEYTREKGDFLIFENENGEAKLLFETDLKRMLDNSETKPEVVIVASCHSEMTGKVFHRAGVKHVICIREKE